MGRPKAEPPPALKTCGLAETVLSFVMQHPGCVYGRGRRQRYSDPFRHFILELCAKHPEVALESFAAVVQVPLGTLRGWLRGGRKNTDAPLHLAGPHTD